MDIIHLLPDAVANQIAAGEVVERPASVIKELLENAIDAGATQLQVVLRDSGKELIQVIDNGKGMSPSDARMAFERHATSKICKADDLFTLHTMGFRGEALASIVAISEVTMRTRRPEDEAGTMLRLAGSKIISQESVVCAPGTNIEVRNLFYNVPGRRKFLKKDATELNAIITELQHVALTNPQVEFVLSHNGNQLLQLTPGNYKQRILQIFSKSLGQQLIPIGVDNDLLRIEGFICQPEGARKKGALQYFFVNDRYMRHPYFAKAVSECYQSLIPEGAQPNYFIYLQVDPSSIDVNVSPKKTEIKFDNEPARWQILMATIREALGKFNAVPTIDFDQTDAPEIQPFDPTAALPGEPKVSYNSDYNPFKKSSIMTDWSSLYEDFNNDKSSAATPSAHGTTVTSRMGGGMGDLPLSQDLLSAEQSVRGTTITSRMSTILDDAPSYRPNQEVPVDPLSVAPSMEANRTATFRKYLQVANTYIVASTKRGMILIDQHQAHVAVLFDRYYQQIQRRQGMCQQELFPETVEVSLADVPLLESILPQLQFLGFELSNLGGGNFAVNGKPASLEKGLNVQELIYQMIEVTREESRHIGDNLDRKLALKLSRMQAIAAGKVLSEEDMSQLVEALFSLSEHTYTPDGRVIACQFSLEELAGKF